MSEKMHMPSERKSVKSIFVVIGACVLIAVVYIYFYIIALQKNDTNVLDSQEVSTVTDESIVVPETPKEISLEATIVEVSEDGTYIRVNTKDEGVISLGIHNDISPTPAFVPGETIFLTASELPDTEMYDYNATAIDVAPEKELSHEERTVRALEKSKIYSN